VLRNIVPLNTSHVLSVRAFDCGMRQSATPAIVRVSVNTSSSSSSSSPDLSWALSPSAVCNPGLNGLAERLDYEPGQGALSLFPSVTLELCDNAKDDRRFVGLDSLFC